MQLQILDNGSCETLKAGVHGAALGLAGIMTLYNAAAWLRRRQAHLAVNAVLYGLAVLWERNLVGQHLASRPLLVAVPQLPDAAEEVASVYVVSGSARLPDVVRPAA